LQKDLLLKVSILKTIKYIKFHFILLTIFSVAILILNTSQNQSSYILKALYAHQEMAQQLHDLSSEDIDYTLIQFQDISNRLSFNSDDMKTRISLDFIGDIYKKKSAHLKEVEHLETLTSSFERAVKNRLVPSSTKSLDSSVLQQQLNASIEALIRFNNNVLFFKETIISYLIYITVFYIIILTLTYNSKLASTIRDIEALTKKETGYDFKTLELDYLNKSLTKVDENRRAQVYFDPLTKLNNLKGLLQKYAKQTLAPSYSYYVYVFGVDGYTQIDKKIPKDNSQAVLKKLAFIISLYEKGNDNVARIGFDSFAVILPREDLDLAYNECEQLRKTIHETSFTFKNIDLKHISISGVFLPKPKDKTLNETITYGLNFLKTSKNREVNSNFKVLGFH
jgi:diguanylate cyclase (GGDEF)-like protein